MYSIECNIVLLQVSIHLLQVDMRRWRTDTGLYDTPYLSAAVFQFPIPVVPFFPCASPNPVKNSPAFWILDYQVRLLLMKIERRLATAVAAIAVWLFFKWESPKFSSNFLKTGIIQMKFLLKGYLKVSGYETLKNKDQVPINPLPFQKLRKFNPHCCCVFWHPNALVDMAWAQTVCVSKGDEGTRILWRSRSTIDWCCCHLNNSWSFNQAAMSSTC